VTPMIAVVRIMLLEGAPVASAATPPPSGSARCLDCQLIEQ
jgi:hypothetical protein